MSNIYDDARSIQEKRNACYDDRSAAFILEGKLSQDVTHKRLNKDIKAALTFNDKEGPDEVIVFSLLEDDLLKGDYFIYNDVNYLVYENVRLTDKDVNYKKQKALECNITFVLNEITYIGYFVSSMRRGLQPDLESKQIIVPNENPLLILPTVSSLEIDSRIKIEEKPWRVIDYDSISNSGISYVYIERNYNTTTETNIVEETSTEFLSNSVPFDQSAALEPSYKLQAMLEYEFITTAGSFVATEKVEILYRSATLVRFRVPYGINTVQITTHSGTESINYEVIS